FSAVNNRESGILARQDSLQDQWESSYLLNTIDDFPGVGGFLADVSAIAFDYWVSERANNLSTVSQDCRRRQWRADLILSVAIASNRHVYCEDYGIVSRLF